jgi:hypothetical protein
VTIQNADRFQNGRDGAVSRATARFRGRRPVSRATAGLAGAATARRAASTRAFGPHGDAVEPDIALAAKRRATTSSGACDQLADGKYNL